MKKKNDPCQKIFSSFYKEKIILFLQCVLSILVGLLIPYFLSKLVDVSISDEKNAALIQYGIITILLAIISFMTNWLQNNHWHCFVRKCVSAMRSEAFERLLYKPLSYFEKYSSGDVLNKLLNDTEIYAQNQAVTMLMLLLNLIRLIGIMVFLFILNIPLALLVSIFLPCYYFFFHWLNQYLRKVGRKERETFSEVFHSSQEKIQGIETIHYYEKQSFFSSIFTKTLNTHYEQSKKLIFFRTLGLSTNSLMLALLPLIVMFIGGMMLRNGNISIGVLLAFYAYLPYIQEPINNLSDWNLGRQGALSVQERVYTLFEIDETNVEVLPLKKIESIFFDNVNFSYNDTQTLIQNFSCEIVMGDRIAIIGQSGSGKSTLLKLILKRVNPTQGHIWLNKEIDLSNVSQSVWYPQIAYLNQEPFLFEDSVLQNIVFDSFQNRDDLLKSMSLANVNTFCSIENVESTMVSQGGDNFSGGEKQRIVLARTIMKQADILILDEATSALDELIEKNIVSNLDEYLKQNPEKIFLTVSHRPEIMRICNKIIEFTGNGKVICRTIN